MTKRTANVSVRNNTDNAIVAISIVHKYSDDYTNEGQWGIIAPGELAEDTMEVEYNTGAFTTGRDWWVVTWFNPEMTTQYFSDPENFRNIIDALEKVAPSAVGAAAGAIAGLASSWTGPGAIAARQAAKRVAKMATEQLTNDESTDGFKQHILRSEDEDELTEIVINEDLTITFKSNSGDSETVSSSREVEQE
ncbi:hypothetical protein G7Z17_g744 [Cylindrodendrum hubeiense]|uniref:Up-regulated in Daf-2 domain-containing protein n=1 Tax=Cylindrodendrum hubeiense TaxID=595255 RepID=A0A9P5HJX7_9HYPO|nr:hypothetical protein G7Z17_g744 [Cylindrodendrum hubeiense]